MALNSASPSSILMNCIKGIWGKGPAMPEANFWCGLSSWEGSGYTKVGFKIVSEDEAYCPFCHSELESIKAYLLDEMIVL